MCSRLYLVLSTFAAAMVALLCLDALIHPKATSGGGTEVIELPKPNRDGTISVERAIQARRSVRDYLSKPLTPAQVSQLLWAAQGINDPEQGRRTVPSAGALYPLEIFLAAGSVEGVPPGLYRYAPQGHALTKMRDGDVRPELSAAAYAQESLTQAPAVLIVTAIYERSSGKYGERAVRFAHMEAGHAGQNVALQAVALGLSTVMVGGFVDHEVAKALGLPREMQPLYLIPIGHGK